MSSKWLSATVGISILSVVSAYAQLPIYEIRGDKVYRTINHPGGWQMAPDYSINEQGSMYRTRMHSEGQSFQPDYQIRGDAVYRTIQNSDGWSVKPSYKLRFRGAATEDPLFADQGIAHAFDLPLWLDAVEARDVDQMADAAWMLKGIELSAGKKDSKTTSDALFDAAAQVAVEQGNKQALDRIVALCPACAKHLDASKGQTTLRGTARMKTALPQIVHLRFAPGAFSSPTSGQQAVDQMFRAIKPWEAPRMEPDLMQFTFRGITAPDADSICWLANRGRATCTPGLLTQAATMLARYKADVSVPQMDSAFLLDEAAALAAVLGDSAELARIVALYESDQVLKAPDKASICRDDLKAMGVTRGDAESSLVIFLRPAVRTEEP